jgi:tetratricopeptide (TPR) repeat protein
MQFCYSRSVFAPTLVRRVRKPAECRFLPTGRTMTLQSWRHRVRARVFELLRRRDAAIAEYRALAKLEPRSARTLHTLAYLLTLEQRYAEAQTHLREALRLEPGNADAWFNLGFICDQQQETQKAVDAFREATRLNPQIDRAWYGLGLGLVALGRHAEAAQALARAAELQPMNGIAWYHLGKTYHTLKMNAKVSEVARHLNRFDRKLCRQLIRETGRADLEALIVDLRDL